MIEHVPVVVVGAGPAGATAANLLGHYGVRTLVLERWPAVYPLPRAVHFDDEVFRIFADMGLAEEVRDISRPSFGMQLTDKHHRVLAEFDRDPARQVHGYPQANMFDQPELERVLRAGLDRYPHVELRAGVDVVGIEQVVGGPAPVRVRYRAADATTDGDGGELREVWADVLLGADGANSTTRAVVGGAMEDFGFDQQWLVVDVDTHERIGRFDGVQQVCDHDRAATFMPVVAGRYRWEFRLRAGEDAAAFDNARVRELIGPWLDGVDTDKLSFVRQTAYTIRGVVAERWRDRRVLLLGDACHQTPPFIGQGMAAGIRDAYNLAWKVACLLDGTADDRVLATYEAERKPYARRVVRLAILVGWVMTGGGRRTAPLRRAALRTLTRLPGIEGKVVEGSWPALASGPLVVRAGRRSLAGSLVPQPRVRAGGRTVLLDEALGDGFAVVYRGPAVSTAYEPALLHWFAGAGVRFVRLGDDLDDLDGVLTGLLDRAGADALLLRPDRVVTATGPVDLRAWQGLLRSAGITPHTSGAAA